MAQQVKFRSTTSEGLPVRRWWPASPFTGSRSFASSLDWTVVSTLVFFVILGFGLRVSNLGAIGFAEDEMNKLDAIHAYEKGDISANGEHPMIMKALMFVSLHASQLWSTTGTPVSDETALRLPNVIFGALTVVPLFLLTAAFFDRWTALLAAGFWAFGVNVISLNRIAKEDTLLVFFMLFAFYFYLRAKQIGPSDNKLLRRNYILSGCSFGLMLASKYFPHYFGLNALYHHRFHVRTPEPGERSGKAPLMFYLLIPIAFLVANPAVLLPQVWSYLNAYMGEKLLVHTGYLFADRLYKNTMSATPFWGTPIYFYALFMAIKIPLAILAAFLVGLVASIRNRKHPGHGFVLFMLFFWLVPYSLVGAKWLRYALSLMPFVYMAAAVGVMAVIRFALSRTLSYQRASSLAIVLLVALFLGFPAWTAIGNGPHYALYTNALGTGHAGYFFPHDEFYDDGLREAIKFVCDNAPQQASIAHETPAVARYYLAKYNRTDMNSSAMSAPEFDPAKLPGPAYIIVQRGRIYFENREKIAYVRHNFRKVHEVSVNGLTAAEVFVNQPTEGEN